MREPILLAAFSQKPDHLPRQARDKHQDKSYKRVLSAGAAAAAGGEASAGEPVSATAAAAAPAVDVSGRWEVSVAYTAGPP